MSKWFRGLRLRLLIVSIIPVIALSVVSYMGLSTADKLNDEIHKAYNVRAKLIETTGDMESAVHASVRMIWTALFVMDPKDRAHAIKKTHHAIAEFEESMAKYLSVPRSPQMVESFKLVQERWPEAKAALIKIAERLEHGDKDATGLQIIETVRPPMGAVTDRLNEMQDQRREIMDKDVKQLEEDNQAAAWHLLEVSAVSGLLALVLGLGIAIRTASAVMRVTEVLGASSDQVSAASTQIASSSQELSQATSEQAASLEQTAASLEEMASMIARNNESSKNASATSAESQSKANEGREAVERMMQSMKDIDRSNEAIMTQVNASNERMAEIVRVIQEIGNRTQVINEIVFQTKLLSFNASVEAARAGEHGKGFAVVAEEVGNLAQMSGNAAKEISDMLAGSMSKVESIVNETKSKVETLVSEGKRKVDSGVEVARQCGSVLDEIVANVSNVSGMASDISSANQEQSQGIAEINKAVSNLDQVTQQNAATSEETAGAAEELSGQAEALKAAVGDLILVIDGKTGPAPSPRPASRETSNVTPLRPARPKAAAAVALKPAAGDGAVPDRDHAGFGDV